MGKKFDLNFLREEESAKILNVLENDFQLRMRERSRLGKMKQKINEEDKLAHVLASQKDFNNNCCIRCYKSFFLLINPRYVCFACKFNVCRNCCSFFLQFRSFVCVTCQKEKDVMTQSCDWFYETVQRRFRQSGSAKVARRLSQNYTNSGGRKGGRVSVLDVFTQKAQQQALPASSPESSDGDREAEEEEEKRQEKLRKAKAFQAAFPEATLRPDASTDNSQKEVLRRMKALQMARFHERVHEAMAQIRSDLRSNYPFGLPSVRDDFSFCQFIRRAREDLTIILKNFAQILAITIESHNLAIGRSSEDVQIDIQHILQDEVEGIVSRRVDVHFDETASLITDEGSKVSALGTVEQRLAAVILRKILDDYRTTHHHHYGSDEEEVLRELDQLIDEVDDKDERDSSDPVARRREVDPDVLSLSVRSGRRQQGSGTASQHSAGSSSQFLLRGRPGGAAIPASSMSGLGRAAAPRVGDRAADELSDLSGGSLGEEAGAAVGTEGSSAEMDAAGEVAPPWAGTSHEETKNELLRQLRQQDSGIGIHYDSSPPSSSHAEPLALESEYRSRQNIAGRQKTKRRIDTLSRDLLTANEKATGTATQMDATAEQMQGIIRQLTALDSYIDNISAQYTPSYALRRSSDHGVATAARALRHAPASKTGSVGRRPRSESHRAQLEEDIYTKAAEMVDVYELIEDLESALLRSPSHSEGEECPRHVQRWCSIEEHVVSTVERLEGDLRDVDAIAARVSAPAIEPRYRSAFDSDANIRPPPRRGDPEKREPSRSISSDVSFGAAPASLSGSVSPSRQSRDAWDDYRRGNS